MVELTHPLIQNNISIFVKKASEEWNIPDIHRQHLEDDLKRIAHGAMKIEADLDVKLNGQKKAVHKKNLLKINKSLAQYKIQNVGKINEANVFGYKEFMNIGYDQETETEFPDEYYFAAHDDDMNIINELEALQKKLAQIINATVIVGRKPNEVRKFTIDRLLRIYQYFNNFKSVTDPEKSHSEKILDPVSQFIREFMKQFTPSSIPENITDHAFADYVAARARKLMETTIKNQAN